jgi:nitrogen regulatory protein PII
MEAAKSKGAFGGTILSARGTANDTEKFFNISIQPEKEMVLIVVGRDKRHEIMQEISTRAGLTTAGQGVAFSLPVDETIGFVIEQK